MNIEPRKTEKSSKIIIPSLDNRIKSRLANNEVIYFNYFRANQMIGYGRKISMTLVKIDNL